MAKEGSTVEIKIGIQHINREIVIDSEESTNDLKAKVAQAISDQSVLELTDSKGVTTLIPAGQIGYVELGIESKRRIGFGLGE